MFPWTEKGLPREIGNSRTKVTKAGMLPSPSRCKSPKHCKRLWCVLFLLTPSTRWEPSDLVHRYIQVRQWYLSPLESQTWRKIKIPRGVQTFANINPLWDLWFTKIEVLNLIEELFTQRGDDPWLVSATWSIPNQQTVDTTGHQSLRRPQNFHALHREGLPGPCLAIRKQAAVVSLAKQRKHAIGCKASELSVWAKHPPELCEVMVLQSGPWRNSTYN